MTTDQKMTSHTLNKISILDNNPEKDYPLWEGACAPPLLGKSDNQIDYSLDEI